MVFKKCILIVTLTLFSQGKFTDVSLSETVLHIAEKLSIVPMSRILNGFTGDVADSINLLADLPTTALLYRALGVASEYSLPILVREQNMVDLTNNIVIDFNAGRDNEDAALNITQLITKYGHPAEKHEVETYDGYILTLFRIPSKGTGTVVFLMHGLLGSADDYVIGGPDHSLAFLLAGEGYDVWLGNARGNKHSRRHSKLHPSEAAFWDFSFHEIGCHDLPAMIDYVLNTTGKKSLKYVGHSQGTTSFFVMASERPEYNEKVSLIIALSPVAFMEHTKSPVVRLLAPGGGFVHAVAKSLGIYEFLPSNPLMRILTRLMCGSGLLAELLCSNALFIVAGFSLAQLDVKHLPVVFGHVPSGCSIKQLAHYGQGVVSKEFRQFDYGVSENFKRYNMAVPPSYDLGTILTPVALFYSDADWLAQPEDVMKLRHELRNVLEVYRVPHRDFNHLDFIWAKDIIPLIYEKVRKILRDTP